MKEDISENKRKQSKLLQFKEKPFSLNYIFSLQSIYGISSIMYVLFKKTIILGYIFFYLFIAYYFILLICFLIKRCIIEKPDELYKNNVTESCSLSFMMLALITAIFMLIEYFTDFFTLHFDINFISFLILLFGVMCTIQGSLMLIFERHSKNIDEEDEDI